MRLQLCLICFLLSVTPLVFAQGRGQLPLGLEYFMSSSEVESQLSELSGYKIDDGQVNTLAYMVPADGGETKNGIFLKFDATGLVEIASMKTDMKKPMYDQYMRKMQDRAETWKEAGVETVWEDDTNTIYIYRDERSRISISGSELSKSADRYSVTLTFTEREFAVSSR